MMYMHICQGAHTVNNANYHAHAHVHVHARTRHVHVHVATRSSVSVRKTELVGSLSLIFGARALQRHVTSHLDLLCTVKCMGLDCIEN